VTLKLTRGVIFPTAPPNVAIAVVPGVTCKAKAPSIALWFDIKEIFPEAENTLGDEAPARVTGPVTLIAPPEEVMLLELEIPTDAV
jgi:hypothetical protein